MAQVSDGALQALVDLITDGGANTAAEFRTILTNFIDSKKSYSQGITALTLSETINVINDLAEFYDASEAASRKTPLYNLVPYIKAPVVAVATSNGTLASAFANGQTVDGVTLATSDRILLAGQTAPEENGIYTVNASGAPTRAVDFAGADQIRAGAIIYVEEGTLNAGKVYKCTSPTVAEKSTFVLGTDNIDFEDVTNKIGNGTTYVDVDETNNKVAVYISGTKVFEISSTGIELVQSTDGIYVDGTEAIDGARNMFAADIQIEGEVYADGEVDDGNSSTADTIDWTTGNFHKSTLTGNCTYTFTAPTGPTTLVLKVIQDGTGSRTVTWPAAVKWPSGTAPTLTTTAAAVDIISFYFDGTNYYGFTDFNFS